MPDKLDRKYIKVKNNTTIHRETMTGNVIQATRMVEFEQGWTEGRSFGRGQKLFFPSASALAA